MRYFSSSTSPSSIASKTRSKSRGSTGTLALLEEVVLLGGKKNAVLLFVVDGGAGDAEELAVALPVRSVLRSLYDEALTVGAGPNPAGDGRDRPSKLPAAAADPGGPVFSDGVTSPDLFPAALCRDLLGTTD